MTKTIESLSTNQVQSLDLGALETEDVYQRVTADQLRSEYNKLHAEFRDRELGRTVLYGAHIYEDSLIATRFYDQRGIEEIWQASDDYSHQFKNGASRNISVRLFDDFGQFAHLMVRDNDQLQLDIRKKNDQTAAWRRGSDEETQVIAFSVLHRSSDARSIQAERHRYEREWTNNHARRLLINKYPDLAASQASFE